MVMRKLEKRSYHLRGDCPPWMSDLCKNNILGYFDDQEKQNMLAHHFTPIGIDFGPLPDEQQLCLSVLREKDFEDLYQKRLHQVADWLRKQVTLWPKKTMDTNKLVKNKADWVISEISGTILSKWRNDATRTLQAKK